MDIQGINGHEPLSESAYVKFRDKRTGEWIEGLSEPKIDPNHFRIHLKVEARDADGNLTGIREGPANLCTNAFAGLVEANIFATACTNQLYDTGHTLRTITASCATSVVTGCAGTTNTAAAVTDYKLGTETETQASCTVGANPNTGTTSGTFTVIYVITAGADRAYVEVGIKVTALTFVFQITHDVFATLNVSSGGTLTVTYTFTNS
jgi:hypothetical protein